MGIRIDRTRPLAQELAKATSVPVDRIEQWVIVVQYDTGIAMLHTLCCEQHAREGLARVAATPLDLPDIGRFTGSN